MLGSFIKNSSEELIDYFESKMTPDKIVFEVLSKIKNS
jgi:hypothetical protein